MLPVDLPTLAELKALAAVRGGPAIALYLETTPLTQQAEASRIEFGNLVRAAVAQLQAVGTDKRVLDELIEPFDDLAEDDEFWAHQARSLVVLATPELFRTYRLANRLTSMVQVSDRLHLKPLLRAVTVPQTGFVLALSENSARLVEFFADMAPEEVRIADLPKDAADYARKASINDRSHSRRIHGSEGKKVRLRQYARAVDAAIRPVLAESGGAPLILASNEPLASIFRQVCTYAQLEPGTIAENIERLPLADMAAAARPILDARHAAALAAFKELYGQRAAQSRVTTELSTAARAATFGAVEAMLVDIDAVVPGRIDRETGAVTLAEAEGADSYGVIDQMALRALLTGAELLAVRKDDLPSEAPFAMILRHPV